MNIISIIIATYNADKVLQRCLNSIIRQKNAETELIIIDGGSKDNTKEIIRKNEQYIDQWISEPDKGIYDAWNKGLSRATGQWIMFLGSDDQLMPNALSVYIDYITANNCSEIDLISSKMEMIDIYGKSIRIKGWEWEWPRFRYDMTIAHPGALHNSRYYQKYGMYNTDFKIVGDYELLLRAKKELNTVFINKLTVKMSEGGVSDSTNAVLEHLKATIHTGSTNTLFAYANAALTLSKIKVKAIARKFGLNIYIRKG